MREIKGNLFDQKVDVVCISTNGSVTKEGRAIMGCGCAGDAEILFPGLSLLLGSAIQTFGNHFHYLQHYQERGYTVAAFPVKHNWDDPEADLKLIEESCKDLVESTMPDVKVALPRVGCGKNSQTWDKVKPILEKYMDDRFVIVDFNV